jgi:hypothetical protein
MLVVRIAGVAFSWTSIRFTIDGDPYSGVRGLDFSEKRERKTVHGAGRSGTPLARTSGKYTVDGLKLKMLVDDADLLTDYLTLKGAGSYGDAVFSFTVEAIEETNLKPIIVVGSTCNVDGVSDSYAEGTDELVKEFDIGALAITTNGKQLWSLIRSI